MNEEEELELARRRSRGATAVEYALIIGLIAAIIFVAVSSIGTATQSQFEDYHTELTNEGG